MPITKGPYYLGRVRRVPHRGDAYHYASIEPLVESDPTGSVWVGPPRHAGSRFPKRGLVHWHDAPLSLQVGSLWQFSIDEHPSAERGDRSERFQLEDPREPIEVIDLRGWSDEDLLRSSITGPGIPLSAPPLARRILLWLASGNIVGPLLLKPGTEEGLWAVDAPETHRDAARMPIYHLAATVINHVPLDGGRWFVSPDLEIGRSGGIQNWMSDAQVARSILSRLRKMDADVVRAIGVTDNLFREYLDHVENGRMGAADPAVERARADRLRGVRSAIQRDFALLKEAAEALLGTDAVRAEVDRQVKSKIEEQLQARQEEIERAVAGASEQLTRLQADVDAKRAERMELEAALIAKRCELEAKIESFDREVTTRLEEIARRPEVLFAESAILRAMLAAGLPNHGVGANGAAPTRQTVRAEVTTNEGPTEASTELLDAVAVRRALAERAGAEALSFHAMLGLHAVFAAGTVPVVAGSSGYELLRAYAATVAGGRLHWVPVGASVMESQDLLGRFDSPSGRIIPSPSGLLDVVLDASHSGRLHVVVLEGFNRAPVEAYLSPILEAAQAGRSGDTARTIPLASPGLLSADDSYRELGRLAWPPSVLIACLPSDGTASLPVPSSVWRFLALLDADDRERPSVPATARNAGPPACTEIATALWRDAVTDAQGPGAGKSEDMISIARALSLPLRDAGDATRIREVLRSNGLPAADATGLAVSATLIPRSGAAAKVVEEVIRTAGVTVLGWQTILAEAQRLRS